MFSWYKYPIINLVFSNLGFWSGNLFLIAPFPDLCLLVPYHIFKVYVMLTRQLSLKAVLLQSMTKQTHFTRRLEFRQAVLVYAFYVVCFLHAFFCSYYQIIAMLIPIFKNAH